MKQNKMHRSKQSFTQVWPKAATKLSETSQVAPVPHVAPIAVLAPPAQDPEVKFDTKAFLETTFAKLEATLASLKAQQNALASEHAVMRKEFGAAHSQAESKAQVQQPQVPQGGIRIPIWLGGLVLVVLTLLLVALLFAVMRIRALESHSQKLLGVLFKDYA
jgi:hypothetical protein